jgi:hypothetical protein
LDIALKDVGLVYCRCDSSSKTAHEHALMSKLLENFHDSPVQHAHCIRLFKIHLDTLKGKGEQRAGEASGAITAAAKNSSGTKEEPQDDDTEYIDSGTVVSVKTKNRTWN